MYSYVIMRAHDTENPIVGTLHYHYAKDARKAMRADLRTYPPGSVGSVIRFTGRPLELIVKSVVAFRPVT